MRSKFYYIWGLFSRVGFCEYMIGNFDVMSVSFVEYFIDLKLIC